MFKRRCVFGAVAGVLVAVSSVWALPILPGVSAIAAAEPDPVGGGVVAGPLVSNLNGAAFTATVTSTVISGDSTNPYGLNALTFIYQVANSARSTDAIGRFTANGFAGWQTDMSFQPSVPAVNLPPATMDRSANANVVGFSFVPPPLGPAALQPGVTSEVLVVQTNATAWTTAVGNVIDGSIANGAIYAPVPEPATLLFLAGGVGLLLRRRR